MINFIAKWVIVGAWTATIVVAAAREVETGPLPWYMWVYVVPFTVVAWPYVWWKYLKEVD